MWQWMTVARGRAGAAAGGPVESVAVGVEQNRRSKPVHGCDGGDGELGAAAGLENGDGDGEGSMRGGGQGSADDGTMVARRRWGQWGVERARRGPKMA